MKPKPLLLCLALLTGLIACVAFSRTTPRLHAPAIRVRSEADRVQTLENLRAAWETRPATVSPENEQAERAFLNRVMWFVRGTQGRETYDDACQFWNECYRDHAERYRDFIDDN